MAPTSSGIRTCLWAGRQKDLTNDLLFTDPPLRHVRRDVDGRGSKLIENAIPDLLDLLEVTKPVQHDIRP
jgi:hypothetical protein